ncbi:hypothetical protein [Rhizobium leguminosarum]|uniref:hypothetical protein n=1 Tax=Rhizobium leguminosarum TaxID=384 RepID=UPI001C91D9A9|nr:hypothetical protein [Rhizobium leguminosarum]
MLRKESPLGFQGRDAPHAAAWIAWHIGLITTPAARTLPRLSSHTDGEVTLSEMSRGYSTDLGFDDPIFYESVIAKSLYNENRLAEIHLFPIDLGHSKRFANRGVPSLADPVKASLILERLQKLSEPFGTKIAIKDGVGIVRPALPVPNHNDAR